jgi:hypothetical protein
VARDPARDAGRAHDGAVPVGDGRTVELRLDLRAHAVRIDDSAGEERGFLLQPRSACADFHDELLAALASLGVRADLDMRPYDLTGPPFAEDRDHDTYDPEAVARYAQVLRTSADVLEEFAGWFNGKQSPVHLFWHSFDLAHARFSGRRAPVRDGAGEVEAEAYSHEVIAFGFWPGDDRTPFPAYYSYTAPAPDGLTDGPLQPAEASWDEASGTATLPYDAVRLAADPERRCSTSSRAPTSRGRGLPGGTSTTSPRGRRRRSDPPADGSPRGPATERSPRRVGRHPSRSSGWRWLAAATTRRPHVVRALREGRP